MRISGDVCPGDVRALSRRPDCRRDSPGGPGDAPPASHEAEQRGTMLTRGFSPPSSLCERGRARITATVAAGNDRLCPGPLWPRRGWAQPAAGRCLVQAPPQNAQASGPGRRPGRSPEVQAEPALRTSRESDRTSRMLTVCRRSGQAESTGVSRHAYCRPAMLVLWFRRTQRVENRHGISTRRTLLPAGER